MQPTHYERADDCISSATELAARQGLPFREAYKIVGEIVAYCLDCGIGFEDLDAEKLRAFHPALSKSLLLNISTERILEKRCSFGGSGTKMIIEAVRRAKESKV